MASSFAIIILSLITFVNCEPKFGQDNVCNKTVTVRTDKTVEEPHRYEIKYEGMCGILPCTKKRTETRMGSKIQTVLEYIQVPTCCPGYAEAPDKQCLPICLKTCNNGICIKPGVCKCSVEPSESSPGYAGSTCKRFVCLAANKWGSKCDRECNCPENSYCSASTGNCLCHSGWRGANCTEECDSTISNCDGAELPPIIEPEANMIEVIGQSQRLEALSPRALQSENEDDVRMAPASNLATHMGINIIFCVFTVMLIGAVFWYKSRLSQVEDKLYYVAASALPTTSSPRGGSGSSNSDYSPYSLYSQDSYNTQNIQSRPLPAAEHSPAKETFGSATRNILQASSNNPLKGASLVGSGGKRTQIIVAPIIETHLMSSQEKSIQNIYSEPDSTLAVDISSYSNKFGSSDLSRRSSNAGQANGNSSGDSYTLNVSSISALENDYQVPKSQMTPTTMPLDRIICSNEESNIYEEILPRTQSKSIGDVHNSTDL